MNEPGVCSFWVKSVDNEEIPATKLALAEDDQHRQVVILQINTENVNLRVIFRRPDFAAMMATPNSADPTEVAINLEEA